MIVRTSNLKFNQWPELAEAYSTLIQNGTMDRILADHNMKYKMHGSMKGEWVAFQRFLPWHRVYLIILEEHLRKINPNLSIPYWDWEHDKGNLVGIKTLDSINNNYWERYVFPYDFLIRINQLKVIMSIRDYFYFSEMLERFPHNAGHVWAGGDMSSIITAPKDPLFWMHHANVDRLWSIWQIRNKAKKPNLRWLNAKLQPWDDKYNVDNVNNTEVDLGYKYDRLTL